MRGGWFPIFKSYFKFCFSQVHINAAVRNVESDDVALAQRRDRSSNEGLRRDMTRHQAARTAGEAAVSQQRNFFTDALAHNRGGDTEHLRHPGRALGTFVSNDDDVSRYDLAR